MKEFKTLQEIVEQLEFCQYQTKDTLHDLRNNAAFVALKERAEHSACNSCHHMTNNFHNRPCSKCKHKRRDDLYETKSNIPVAELATSHNKGSTKLPEQNIIEPATSCALAGSKNDSTPASA